MNLPSAVDFKIIGVESESTLPITKSRGWGHSRQPAAPSHAAYLWKIVRSRSDSKIKHHSQQRHKHTHATGAKHLQTYARAARSERFPHPSNARQKPAQSLGLERASFPIPECGSRNDGGQCYFFRRCVLHFEAEVPRVMRNSLRRFRTFQQDACCTAPGVNQRTICFCLLLFRYNGKSLFWKLTRMNKSTRINRRSNDHQTDYQASCAGNTETMTATEKKHR